MWLALPMDVFEPDAIGGPRAGSVSFRLGQCDTSLVLICYWFAPKGFTGTSLLANWTLLSFHLFSLPPVHPNLWTLSPSLYFSSSYLWYSCVMCPAYYEFCSFLYSNFTILTLRMILLLSFSTCHQKVIYFRNIARNSHLRNVILIKVAKKWPYRIEN
jgi:hypothetical protein